MSPSSSDEQANPSPRLWVSGTIQLAAVVGPPVVVSRGMAAASRDGEVVGTVAAVVVDGRSQTVTDLVLLRPTEPPEYRLLPVAHIAGVTAESVVLRVAVRDVDGLAVHEAV